MFRSLFPAAEDAAKRHAEAEYPRESIGFVRTDGSYVPLANRSPTPDAEAYPDPLDWVVHDGAIAAVVHSHPFRAAEIDPADGAYAAGITAADWDAQKSWGVPGAVVIVLDGLAQEHVIWWGDELRAIPGATAPLLGRPFVNGVWDCYSLIRDYYRVERNIVLPDHAREYGWWGGRNDYTGATVAPTANLYLDHFAAFGFRPIAQADLRPGDCFLAQIKAAVPNHAGVVTDDFQILHHLCQRLSMREPANPWLRHGLLTTFLRYDPK